MSNSFMTDEFKKGVQEIYKTWEGYMLWGAPPDTRTDEEKYEADIKIAYVFIEGKHVTLGVNNKDMKGYELGEWYSVNKPLK